MKVELDYSYLSAWTGSNFAAFKAGNIDTIIVIKIEHKEIINIEDKLISDKLNEKSKIYLYQTLNNECSICLKSFIFNDIIRELDCNHKFHILCIDKWFEKNISCPNCRYNLK